MESKQTNQLLAILNIFNENPENLKVKFISINFSFGNYPVWSRFVGYSLSIDVKEVDLKKYLDVLTV